MRRAVLDTGPLVAFFNPRDAHHDWALAQTRHLASPLLTCEAVITEAHHLLGRVPGARAALLRWLGSGRASFPFRYVDHAGAVVALLETYADQRMDFADACVVRMVEVESLPVFTLDVRDFSVYRIHRDHPLDLIAPDWI